MDNSLNDFICSLATSSLLSFPDFVDLIRGKDKFKDISNDSLGEWYSRYEKIDLEIKRETREHVSELVKKLNQTTMSDIISLQAGNSYSLEEMINNLYKVGILLETRTNVLNKSLEANINTLSEFGTKIKDLDLDSSSLSTDKILQTLDNYKNILQKLGSPSN